VKDLLLCLCCGAFGALLATYVMEMIGAWCNDRKNKENDW
jgi:hypothetical protein